MPMAGTAAALSVLVLDCPSQRCYVVVEELITADYPSYGVHKLTCWLFQGLDIHIHWVSALSIV